MKSIKYYIIFLFFPVVLEAQNGHYVSIKSEGPPPEYFSKTSKQKTSEEVIVTSPYRPRNERIAEIEFYKSSHYWVNDLLGSGKVLYGEKIQAYLTKLINKIAESNGINDQIFVHPVKYGYFNAFATDVGLLFVNIGLLSKVRNEAELAMVLSHELAHYYKKHNLEGHMNQYKLESLKEYSKMSSYDKVVSKHSYSRKLESEADSLGFVFYVNAGYSPEFAASVFDIMINDQHLGEGIDLNSIIDFKSINNEISQSIKDSLSRYIVADTIEQEELRTHPDSKKRKMRIESFAAENTSKTGKEYIISEAEFNEVKKLANLEECRLSLLEQSYFDAYYYGMYNYQKNSGPKEYAVVTMLQSLVGLFQYKTFDPINNPRYKDYGGLSNSNLNQNSDYIDIAYYFAMHDNQFLIDKISDVFEKFNAEFPNSEQLKVLQNWFVEFVEKEIKPFNSELTLKLKKESVKEAAVSNKKKIYIDPSFTAIDFRKVYKLDYLKTEKENLKVISNMQKYNKMSERYKIYSVANKNNLTVSDLNNQDLITSRIEEIESYPKEDVNVFPTDYYELKELCERDNSSIVASSYAITAYIKRVKLAGTIICFYTIILSPLAIYLSSTPDQYTFIDYYEYDLLSGKTLSQKEAYKNTRLSGSIFRDLYFPRK